MYTVINKERAKGDYRGVSVVKISSGPFKGTGVHFQFPALLTPHVNSSYMRRNGLLSYGHWNFYANIPHTGMYTSYKLKYYQNKTEKKSFRRHTEYSH